MNAKEYLEENQLQNFLVSIEVYEDNKKLNKRFFLNDILEDYHKQKLKSKIKLKEIDFDKPIKHKENNDFSQRLFKDNEKIFRGQCKIVAEALKRGERLSVVSAIQCYGIGDLRRRIKDLKDNYGVKNITWEMNGRSKVWFLK